MSSFHVIRFKKKNEFVHELKMLHSLTRQFALNIYSKIRVQAV